MKTILVCVIVGFMVLPCMAAETLVDTYKFGHEDTLRKSMSDSEMDNTSVPWIHSVDGLNKCTQVSQATLIVGDRGIDNGNRRSHAQKNNTMATFRGQAFGSLQGNSTAFDLPPSMFEGPMNANARIAFKNDPKGKSSLSGDFDWRDTIYLKRPTVTLIDTPVTTPATVPVPGALLLSGIGTLLVGILRRRRSV